ncbi:RecA-family ATPase [Bradyrhizobium sp. AZCC 1721]
MRNMNGETRNEKSNHWEEFTKQYYSIDPLPLIDPRDWHDQPVPERQWLVEGIIPHRAVTLYSGDGGTGKTTTAIQLIVAVALGLQWFGKDVTQGRALLYTAEDESAELHRRFAAAVTKTGRTLADLDDVRVIPMAGLDATLAGQSGGKGNIITTTAAFAKLTIQIEEFKPRLVVLDPLADCYGGDEINRSQVRQFVQKLAGLAFKYDCTVMLLSHPSLTGMNSGTGLSGSTAWNASVRGRLYLTHVKDDPDRRVIKVVKTNYGKVGEEIPLMWDDGGFVVDGGNDPAAANMANRAADEVFMDVFWKLSTLGFRLSPNVGSTYAPKKIAEHPDAKRYSKQKMAQAMQRLLEAGTLKIETVGPQSKRRDILVATVN